MKRTIWTLAGDEGEEVDGAAAEADAAGVQGALGGGAEGAAAAAAGEATPPPVTPRWMRACRLPAMAPHRK